MDVDARHDVAVDLADQDHAGDVEGLGVGDAQAVAELRLHAEPAHQLADLRAAAVHDHRPDADRAQQHDVVRERVGERGVDHRVAAVLHDDGAAAEPLDVRQCLDEDGHRRVAARVSDPTHEVPMFSSTYACVRSLVMSMASPVAEAEVGGDLEVAADPCMPRAWRAS